MIKELLLSLLVSSASILSISGSTARNERPLLSGEKMAVTASSSLKGSGTYNDPYEIENKEDLTYFSNSVNSGTSYNGQYVILTSDIDFEGESISPIGLYGGEQFFEGCFDGRGHKISNLNISEGNAGLFGALGGVVINLGLNANISGTCVGGISSHSSRPEAIIANCYTETTFLSYERAGAIADNFNGSIYNCWSDPTFKGDGVSGGIISYSANDIENCITTAEIAVPTLDESEMEGCQTVEPNELHTEASAEKLNTYIDECAIRSDYEFSLNKWELSEDKLSFSNEAVMVSTHIAPSSSLDGSGTYGDPYLINDAHDLAYFSQSVNSGNSYDGQYLAITADIDFEGCEFVPIGVYEGNYFFEGLLDGRGHEIKRISIFDGNAALFGMLGGIVINLGLDDAELSGSCIGGIASHVSEMGAAIINCYARASFTSYARAGGIADNFDGYIYNCWSDPTFEGEGITGGIVSYAASIIENCLSTAETEAVESGCKTVTAEELHSEASAEMMNSFIESFSMNTDFDFSLNKWEVANDKLSFSNERVEIETTGNVFGYALSHFYYLWPFLFLIVPFIVVPIVIAIKNRKKDKKN